VRLEAEAAGLAERLGNEESARAELVRDMGRYGEIWGDIGRYRAEDESARAELVR